MTSSCARPNRICGLRECLRGNEHFILYVIQDLTVGVHHTPCSNEWCHSLDSLHKKMSCSSCQVFLLFMVLRIVLVLMVLVIVIVVLLTLMVRRVLMILIVLLIIVDCTVPKILICLINSSLSSWTLGSSRPCPYMLFIVWSSWT